MPHHVSPPRTMPTMISKAAGPAPTQEEVAGLLDSIFTAATSDASVSAAYALCDLFLNSVGFRGLSQYGVLAAIKKAAADKKASTKPAYSDPSRRSARVPAVRTADRPRPRPGLVLGPPSPKVAITTSPPGSTDFSSTARYCCLSDSSVRK